MSAPSTPGVTGGTAVEYGPDSGGRLKVKCFNIWSFQFIILGLCQKYLILGPFIVYGSKGVTVVKPVVIGNFAKYFGKKREEDGHTHQWNIYLKPYPNEDYSSFIKKVHFKLHDSYANPNRVITKPPYEVQETGWGEFEVVIKVYFVDPVERPVGKHFYRVYFSGDIQCSNLSIWLIGYLVPYSEVVPKPWTWSGTWSPSPS